MPGATDAGEGEEEEEGETGENAGLLGGIGGGVPRIAGKLEVDDNAEGEEEEGEVTPPASPG